MSGQQAFQQLRGACVHLAQSVANLSKNSTARTEVVDSVDYLLQKLREVCSTPQSIDPKLAEYVFLPLSHVLKASQKVPLKALESCLECILILLQTGWKTTISPELAGQFLILLTFLANPASDESGIRATSEELQVVSFKCMAALFTTLSTTKQGRQLLTATANIPGLGRAVLVILDTIVDNTSHPVRLSASEAFKTVILAIDDQDALASFLPRMVSSLTKVLTPSSTTTIKFRLLEQCLDILSLLFLRILSDRETKALPPATGEDANQNASSVQRTTSWLNATAGQIKIALSNTLKLRRHQKHEVRSALCHLCITVIRDCRSSLSESVGMVAETLVALSGDDQGGPIEKDLQNLITGDPGLAELLRESLRSWIFSLPRVMQSEDDVRRIQTVHQISVAFRLLTESHVDLGIINRLLAENLRDSVSSLWKEAKGITAVVQPSSISDFDSSLVLGSSRSTVFEPFALPLKGQDDIMGEFQLLVKQLSTSESSVVVAQDLVSLISSGKGVSQLAAFWLSVNLVEIKLESGTVVDEFLDFGGTPNDAQLELLDELYSFSLSLLTDSEAESDLDWRFPALALQVIALQANQYKSDFQGELIDALYPVIHLLGSSTPHLRNHAITCLNIMADACGYSNTVDLVVSNVDYLVNAVGLKLNTFDISPQAPQVLLMMMRLCGPSLLPYVDDLVESMFSALENFHGYPKLVELLFSVLKGLVEEGVKAPQLAITDDDIKRNPLSSNTPSKIQDVVQILATMKAESSRADDLEATEDPFPHRPWKEGEDETTRDASEPQENSTQNETRELAESHLSAPKTYSILLKISQLTQHYLTSSSSSLRNSLLSLLNTTVPALAKHQDSFLPLINTLWPVLLPRLDDPEPYVVSSALEIMAVMCDHAGDFMRSRIEGLWEKLKSIYRRMHRATSTNSRESRPNFITENRFSLQSRNRSELMFKSLQNRASGQEHYVDAPTRLIWESLVKLLCNISAHVTVRDEFFDDIVGMLEPVLDREDVASALEVRNPDAVWLCRLKRRKQATAQKDSMDILPKVPILTGKPHWKFVQLDANSGRLELSKGLL